MATTEETSAITISSETQRCFLCLNSLCSRLELGADDKSSDEESQTLASCQDALGRFRVWASNIGAAQPARSNKSLDYRLRDALKMKSAVISGLKRLRISANQVLAILSGLAPNRETDMGIADSDDNTGPRTPTSTELQELLLTVQDLLRHLFSLSILIRRRRPKGRLPPSTPFEHPESSPDVINVGDRFPKLKQRPWLPRRLGNVTAQRRHTIQYRQTHRESLAQIHSHDETKTLTGSGSATTFEEPSLISGLDWPLPTSGSSRLSVLTTATYFNSNFDGEGIMGRKIPDLSDMVLEGVRLEYGSLFECPYCRTIQVAENRLDWKRHVYADLQPYVCTFEDCRSATTYFETRHAWFDHETEVHRQKWYCHLCSRDGEGAKQAFTFTEENELKTHFLTKHQDEITAGQLPLILAACKVPLSNFGPSSCPFCDEWLNQTETPSLADYDNSAQFCRHLARHLQQIALDALPIAIEGLEINSPENSDEADRTDAAESNHDSDSDHLDRIFEEAWEPLS
ncbi:hypothetical protein QBC37DRAFT_136615 [Rhypophila decipiens]|uniref:C2H2-type domain-containing protein n=1 Tax=Rhypophila decipiens TaxID=261697 RepID=A0AAN7BB91_9PEZI|nr:hypothetical protein QBC37DRAFT_136615 [Rhypophila decipiens]